MYFLNKIYISHPSLIETANSMCLESGLSGLFWPIFQNIHYLDFLGQSVGNSYHSSFFGVSLSKSCQSLVASPEPHARLVVECSGVAEPESIAAELEEPI